MGYWSAGLLKTAIQWSIIPLFQTFWLVFRNTIPIIWRSYFGGVAEWSNAPVLKTGEPQGSGGSNPSPSAISLYFPEESSVNRMYNNEVCYE